MSAGERGDFIYISDELVRRHLSVSEVTNIVRDVYRSHGEGEAWLSEPPALFLREGANQVSSYKIKGASVPSKGITGFRLIGNTPKAGDKEPWTYRYCYLTDPCTARPLAIIDEYYQSALRTGVTGAVALSLLGNKDSKILGIIGAGNIARHLLEALHDLFSLREIRVHSRSKASQESFVREMESLLGVRVVAVDSPELVVRGADLVITITDADVVLISPGWLSDGATLCSMGNNQELDSRIIYEVDKLIVDDLDFCRLAGDIHAWISRGYLKESEILERLHGTVSEVITGRKPGRENAHEKILVIVQGMASCDLALARFIYDKLRDSEEVQRLAMNDSHDSLHRKQ